VTASSGTPSIVATGVSTVGASALIRETSTPRSCSTPPRLPLISVGRQPHERAEGRHPDDSSPTHSLTFERWRYHFYNVLAAAPDTRPAEAAPAAWGAGARALPSAVVAALGVVIAWRERGSIDARD